MQWAREQALAARATANQDPQPSQYPVRESKIQNQSSPVSPQSSTTGALLRGPTRGNTTPSKPTDARSPVTLAVRAEQPVTKPSDRPQVAHLRVPSLEHLPAATVPEAPMPGSGPDHKHPESSSFVTPRVRDRVLHVRAHTVLMYLNFGSFRGSGVCNDDMLFRPWPSPVAELNQRWSLKPFVFCPTMRHVCPGWWFVDEHLLSRPPL